MKNIIENKIYERRVITQIRIENYSTELLGSYEIFK